jgi:hypothetical protein
MKLFLSRRKTILGLFTVAITSVTARFAIAKTTKHNKVVWKKISNEIVGPGDMWASHDPNTPERQQNDSNFNLIMQAVHCSNYGTPAKEIGIGNGGFWRPIGIVAC